MSQDQFDGQETPATPTGGDDDINISNTGQRVRAILVVIIVLVAGGGALWYLTQESAKKEAHEKASDDFQAAHRAGYEAFWKATQMEGTGSISSNEAFEQKLKTIIANDPVAYGTYLKEKCLPTLDKAIDSNYKKIVAAPEYQGEAEAVVAAAENLSKQWSTFADGLAKYEDFLKNHGKVKKNGNEWLGAQQDPKKDDHKVGGLKYFNLLQCLLPKEDFMTLPATEIASKLGCEWDANGKSLSDEVKAQWFENAAFTCIPALANREPTGADKLTAVIENYNKAEPGAEIRYDATSGLDLINCLKANRSAYESVKIKPVFDAWRQYRIAQNKFIKAVKVALGKIDNDKKTGEAKPAEEKPTEEAK